MMTEAEMSQDLQIGSWRLRRADAVVPAQGLAVLRPWKSQCFSLNLKGGNNQRPKSKQVRQEELPLPRRRVSAFGSIQAFT